MAFHYPPVNSRLQRGGCYLTSVGTQSYQKGQQYPVKGHQKAFAFEWSRGRVISDFAIVMIVDGTGEWESPRGQKQHVSAGDLIYLVPGGWHRYRAAANTGWQEKWCCLSGSVVHGFVSEGILPDHCILVPRGTREGMEAQLDGLVRDVLAAPTGNRALWGGRALALLLEGFEKPQPMAQPAPAGNPITAEAIRYILENAHRPIHVQDVALHCGIERRTLERHFQRAGLECVGRRIIEERLVRAERLLTSTVLQIKEIAYTCGFERPQRMIYDFRRFRGSTPGEIRRQKSD